MSINVSQPQASRQARIDRAVAKALEQARTGNLPTLLRTYTSDPLETWQVWSVGSRTVAGTVYLIDLKADADGLSTLCSCQAGDANRICWHRAAARMAALGEIDHHEGTRLVAATASPAA
jgi:hypothetical protein